MTFSETTDHNSLLEFYRQNGLEVSDNIVADDGAIFSIKCDEGDKTVAAATLSFRFGVYILDYIAVDKQLRNGGYGKVAIDLVSAKARQLGADRIYITAKTPAFFERIGFLEGAPQGVDMNADCIGCPQFGNGCVKKPMYLEL